MASNSKKRRRVLGASCILAALIIASSSFAWFASKDEVTNRLTAQADFGVKIVESFAPPTNWLPGQEVNKDVYATNTGSIPAFVKETVTGAMTVTVEKDTPELTANSKELTQEERYAVEAGAFLAYKPQGSAKVLGDVAVVRPADAGDPKVTDFVPDETGLYVFRRSVKVSPTDTTETFVYDGYYYKDTKFYKISDLYTIPDVTEDKANDDIRTDGNLTAASAGFVEEEQKVIKPMDIKYVNLTGQDAIDAGVAEGKYLVAEYDTGNTGKATKLTVLAKAYDEAIHEYEYAQALQQQAVAELEDATSGAGGLDEAKLAYDNAKIDMDYAKGVLDNALAAYDNAYIAKKNADEAFEEAEKDYTTSMTKLYGGVTGTTVGYDTGTNALSDQITTYAPANDITNGGYTAGSLYGKKMKADKDMADYLAAHNDAYNDFDNFVDELKAYFNGSSADRPSKDFSSVNDLGDLEDVLTVAQLEAFKEHEEAAGEAHKYYALSAAQAIATFNYDAELKKCVGTGTLDNPEVGSYKAAYDEAYTTKFGPNGNDGTDAAFGVPSSPADNSDPSNPIAAVDATGANKTLEDAKAAYNQAVSAYVNAYNTYVDALNSKNAASTKKDEAQDLLDAAEQAWTKAKTAYENATHSGHADYVDLTTDGVIKVYIKLSDKVVDTENDQTANNQWYLSPNPVVNDKAIFYYTGMVEGGETTSKLIDSVTLDPKVTQDMYKSFDFDLNVALDSVQVTYDADKNLLADATPTELGKIATINGGTATSDVNANVKWSDTKTVPVAPAAPSYAVGTTYTAAANDKSGTAITGGVIITKIDEVEDSTAATTKYQYVITQGDDKYYGTDIANTTKFYKGTVSGGVATVESTEYITLTSTANKV